MHEIDPTEEAVSVCLKLEQAKVPEEAFTIVYHTVFANPDQKLVVLEIAQRVADLVPLDRFTLVFFRAIKASGLKLAS